jgi:predicted MPP superfamily phosphohydrolase
MGVTKRQFIRAAVGLGVAGGFSGVAAVQYAFNWEPDHVVAETRTIRVTSLPSAFDGLKIALLSDFHLYPFTTKETIQKAIGIANEFQPDIALLAGDFVYGSADSIFDLRPVLTELNPKKGIFAVMGNHDHRQGVVEIAGALSRGGIEVLNNRGVTIQIGADSIYLAGIDSASQGNPMPAAAFENRKRDQTSIVLVHEPDIIDELVHEVPVDLQLSGHSHGGQVRLPLLGALMLPDWGQIYSLGLYQVGRAQIYTTRGVGKIGVPIRVNCPPEVTCITLRS